MPDLTTNAQSPRPRPRRRSMRRSGIAAFGVASALSLGVALGAPADTDLGFGRDGRATIGAGGDEYGNAIAVQPDGRIVVAGETSLGNDAVVFRLNPDGSPDRGFDGDGARAIDGGGFEGANAVALQPDGGIVAVGDTSVGGNGDVLVSRLTPAGAPDATFDGDGVRTIDGGGAERAHAVALQPDGGIVVAGFGLGGKNAMVWRLTRTGAPDPGFGTGGARPIDLGGTTEIANAVAIQPDGKIVVAGRVTVNGAGSALAVRLNPDGSPDPSFGGGDSIATLAIGTDDRAHAVAIQPDGKIVMAGATRLDNDATAYRLTAAGEPDPAFGAGGMLALRGGDDESAYALALQPDGRIIVAGRTTAGKGALVYRLRSDGSRDAGFGIDGRRVLTDGGPDEASAVAVQADGRILVTGDDRAADQDVLVHRLQGDGPPAAGPGPTAQPVAARCAGVPATVTGTPRRDRIRGTRRRDVIAALGGDDVIRGLGGNDLVCAGAGNDLVLGGAGRDRLIGGAGRDRLVGGAGRDRLVGGPGRDRLRR